MRILPEGFWQNMTAFQQWETDLIHKLVTRQVSTFETISLVLTVFLWPVFIFGLVLLLIQGFKHSGELIRAVASRVVPRKYLPHDEMTFLELSFPANTSKSSYATEQFYTLIHTLARQKTFLQKLIKHRKNYSLEIVSTKSSGIRYILVAPSAEADIIKRSLLSYLPGIKIKEVEDTVEKYIKEHSLLDVAELKLSRHFALSLQDLKTLSKHDPISYITGVMTKLNAGELVAFQLVATPVLSQIHTSETQEMNNLRSKMYKQEPLNDYLRKKTIPLISIPVFFFKAIIKVIDFTMMFTLSMIAAGVDSSGKSVPFLQPTPVKINVQEILNPYEQDLRVAVKEKIDQPLFETSIRFLVISEDEEEISNRISGFLASFGPFATPYQSLTAKGALFNKLGGTIKRRLSYFVSRMVTRGFASDNPILSASEISDIYHFPYSDTTKTEDIVKVYSKDLPAPLSLKKGDELDVVFGVNSYGGKETDIGLTDETRDKHVFIVGATGSGKSTVLFNMASCDIQKGRGVAVIDPHGDLAEDLISTVPFKRLNEFVYINPFDLKYPVGINLLELPEGLDEDELELEKELVCESVITIFRRVFTKEDNIDAHRIEYILRNTIYTAFTVNDRTIFTIYNLLNDPDYRKGVLATLSDENLQNFWKNEFGKAGNFQIVKMVSGVTAKVGRFLFSPTARRILEQKHSTINFDEILSQKKILICNLAEGKLGEDTSQILGMAIISKIQQAAQRRVRQDITTRIPFYLYIDEFQNFATSAFTKILSGGRKFGLRITIAEQSTSQQKDKDIVNIILANIGTVICFRTAGLHDEQYMLNQFSPYIEKGELANLPRYCFYMKISAVEPEEPFSGKTLKMDLGKDPARIKKFTEASRKNYATVYEKPVVKKVIPKVNKDENNTVKAKPKSKVKKDLPENRSRN